MPKKSQSSQKDQPLWDTLHGLSAAVGQCTQISSLLIPYLHDKDLLERIGDKARFNRLGAALTQDIRGMTSKLDCVRQRHESFRGDVKNMDERMLAIELHQEYIDWAYRFDDVILPSVMDMFEMLRAAGADGIETLHLPRAVDAVEKQS